MYKYNTNVISCGKLTDKNTIISKGNVAKIIDKQNQLIAVACNIADCNNNMNLKERWHRKLGHINFVYLDKLCNQQLVTGIPNKLETEFLKCKICIEYKMHNLPFKNNRTKIKNI